MLIVNDDHLCLAGVASLEERCSYCSKPLTEYPLIMSDDANLAVYHTTCALELATEINHDLSTFFSSPAPYNRLFVLTTSGTAPAHETSLEGASKVCASQNRPDKG